MARKSNKGQQEFGITPERTPLGKKAVEYLNLKGEKEKIDVQLERAKNELIILFREENKSSIKIDGQSIGYSHLEKDRIVVKSEKDKY